jgi:hypothetical protein
VGRLLARYSNIEFRLTQRVSYTMRRKNWSRSYGPRHYAMTTSSILALSMGRSVTRLNMRSLIMAAVETVLC